MSILDRIRRLFSDDRARETSSERIDAVTAARGTDHLEGGTEGGGLPPNYLPTGMDEGRPKK